MTQIIVSCNHCPCLNSDYENGSNCNLEYETEFTDKFEDKWQHLSFNCKLDSIKYGSSAFTPKVLAVTDSKLLASPSTLKAIRNGFTTMLKEY